MKKTVEYNKIITGVLAGFIFPFVVGILIYFFTAGGRTIAEYIDRIVQAHIVTHAITICVFPNVLIFLLFNRFDMLKASRGILGMTILWAISVFIIKFS